jgi:methionyl-tRNA synthetase
MIVIVANLQPRKLRGLNSCGMLLAAKQGEQLRLIVPDGSIVSGASVG